MKLVVVSLLLVVLGGVVFAEPPAPWVDVNEKQEPVPKDGEKSGDAAKDPAVAPELPKKEEAPVAPPVEEQKKDEQPAQTTPASDPAALPAEKETEKQKKLREVFRRYLGEPQKDGEGLKKNTGTEYKALDPDRISGLLRRSAAFEEKRKQVFQSFDTRTLNSMREAVEGAEAALAEAEKELDALQSLLNNPELEALLRSKTNELNDFVKRARELQGIGGNKK